MNDRVFFVNNKDFFALYMININIYKKIIKLFTIIKKNVS